MRSILPSLLPVLLAFLATVSTATAQQQGNTSTSPSILLYTKTAGFRHESIPAAIDVVTRLGTGEIEASQQYSDPSFRSARWTTVHSEDQSKFEQNDYLKQFGAVVFAFTTDVDPPGTGTILTDKGAQNLFKYIEDGGNFVGIHSSTNTLYAYPAYGRLVGGFFSYHAQAQDVTLKPISRNNPAVSRLPDTFKINEEMYHLRSSPLSLPAQTEALLSNSTPYSDPGGIHNEGVPQPLAWSRSGSLLSSNTSIPASANITGDAQISGGPGRAFITTLGHQTATWATDVMRAHVHGGIAWALQNSAQKGGQGSTAPSGDPVTPRNAASVPRPRRIASLTGWTAALAAAVV